MAYDRYDSRRERSPDYDHPERSGGRRDERGFFERAGDEIASWFGDDEAERRRREDERMNRDRGWNRDYGWGRGRDYDRGYGRDMDRDRSAFRGSSGDFQRNRDQDRNRQPQPRSTQDWDRYGYSDYDRDTSPRGYGYSPPVQGYGPAYVGGTGYTGGFGYNYGAGESYGSSGYGGSFGHGNEGRDRDRERDRERDRDRERERSYRPMAGDYGRSGTPWARDDYRNTSYAGAALSSGRDSDRHYHAWRQRQLDELDRDYDRYHRERQERFENDFGTWRQNRMGKRERLGQIREHMDVVGSDGDTVGKVDCVKGDHIVLTKGDSPDNRHHAIDCSMIETVEGNQVRLDIPAEEAKSRWEDAGDGDRGFFGRGESNDRDRENRNDETNLNRSFSGTYES